MKASDNNYDTQWVGRRGQYFVGQPALGGVVFLVYFDNAGVEYDLVTAIADETSLLTQAQAVSTCDTKAPAGH